MKFIVLFLLSVFLTGCLAERNDGYFPLPEKYYGEWIYGHTPPRGITLTKDQASFIDPRDNIMHEQFDYKIYHQEDGVFYGIQAEKFFYTEWIDPQKPHYNYIKIEFEIQKHYLALDSEILRLHYNIHCDLTEKDWNLPASIHIKRLKDPKSCIQLGHNNSSYWYREIK